MHKLKEIEAALALLDQYDGQIRKTARTLGINCNTLRSWKEKRSKNIPLLRKTRNKRSKWTDEEKKIVIDYYFNHGENAAITSRKFGYPSYSLLKLWVKEDKRWKLKHKAPRKGTKLSPEQKKSAVTDLITRETSAKIVAEKFNVSTVSLYIWQKELTGEKIMKKSNQKQEKLEQEVIELRKEKAKLLLENQVLKKANEIIKKEIGTDYSLLNNKEKTLVVSALKNSFSIKELLLIINLKKSTYFYELKQINHDKYEKTRILVKTIFEENYKCYGYRRIKGVLDKEHKVNISEKVVRRLMKEENLFVYIPRSKKKYSSYKGEISPEVPNIVDRKFIVDEPHKQALTDITEFALKDGKVYLSPMIDCFDGSPITWTISKSPNADLTNTMLKQTQHIVKDAKLLVHSDRGFHYRLESWIKLMNKYGYTRSMSKKGCSPDNSMCEGFFGTIKNEFFYSKDWRNTKSDDFIIELDKYLNWFVNKRVKKRLNYLSPKNFMLNYSC